MSPVNDMFLSGSLDKTIRIWDLKAHNSQVSFDVFIRKSNFNIHCLSFIVVNIFKAN